jgi:hypothetical protein
VKALMGSEHAPWMPSGGGVAAIKAKGKRQKAKGKSTEEKLLRLLPFAFCLLPFALSAATPLPAGDEG